MKIHLGTVGHFGIAVADPQAAARWWKDLFDLEQIFAADDVVGISNDAVTIVLRKGEPHPETIGHMAFACKDMATLRSALENLRAAGVALEDPGNEIGPQAEGSRDLGLWFTDPQGYRWELSVLGGAGQS